MYQEQGEIKGFYSVIEALLVDYYDPMYNYQHSCRQGHCGSCILQLLSGDVMHEDCLVPLSPGEILACQAKPITDIKIGLHSTLNVSRTG
jgi:ferredoxin/3-ketosteroid 9alpha-monooxygenase subunit B